MGLWQGAAQPGRVRLDAIIEAGLGPSLCHTLRMKISPCPHPNDVGGCGHTCTYVCVCMCALDGLGTAYLWAAGSLGRARRDPWVFIQVPWKNASDPCYTLICSGK